MASQKPTFIFFKMLNCGHCTQFADNPTPETSPWATLLRDKELQAAVNFVRYDWGMEKAPEGGVVQHKLPEQYKFVNYGPYFYMHNAQSVNNGLEFKSDSNYPRTPAGMKKWILDNLRKDPKLANASRVPVTALPAQVPAPQAAPAVVPPKPIQAQAQRPPMLAQNAQVQSLVQGRPVQQPQQQVPQVQPQYQQQQPQPVVQQQPQVQMHGRAIKVTKGPEVRANIISRNRRRY